MSANNDKKCRHRRLCNRKKATVMFEQLKKLWTTPTAEELALRELEDSKRRLLQAQTAREYADSMCKYRETQVRRLTAYIKEIK
jgi:hypothetical protein